MGSMQLSAANYLKIIYHCRVLQINRVDWLAGSFSRTSCSITGNYTGLLTIMVTMNLAIPLDLLHKCCQLPLDSIARKTLIQNFN